MARTAEQNKQWWLDMADRYDREAPSQKTAAKQTDYRKRAAAARTHAETYR